MSAKTATPTFLKIKIIWNESYDFTISLHEVTSKILSSHSNYIEDVVMWPKSGNSRIPMREVIITSILKGFTALTENRYIFYHVW